MLRPWVDTLTHSVLAVALLAVAVIALVLALLVWMSLRRTERRRLAWLDHPHRVPLPRSVRRHRRDR